MQDEWEFDWDPNKSKVNAKKHGISFEDARKMWEDTYLKEVHLYSDMEERWAAIARLPRGFYTAIITYRGEYSIRIISVRKSTKKEVEVYAKH